MSAQPTSPRAVCARCRRPEVVCYCRFVTPLETRTRVVILQHPRERDVPINTARIASLCLPEAELHVGVRWDALPVPLDPSRPAALLYPGPGAIDVEASPPPGPITLVVVDGTWWQAKSLVRDNPALAALPRYAFRPPAPSDYRIRREPEDEYVSTIEALVHVLGVLEGDPARFEAMLVPFRAMVDAQLAFAAQGGGRPRRLLHKRRAPRADPALRLDAVLRERAEDLVCVHGEANAWPYGTPERAAGEDELVQWVAHRVATGETFEMLVAPRGGLAPRTPHHLGVPRESLLSGATHEALGGAWAAFLRPSDVVCTWGTYAPGIFKRAGGALGGAPVDLRRQARLFALAKVGTMDALLAQLGRAEPPPLALGRAGARLAQLVTIARALSEAAAKVG